jgi:hypothetical protein
LRNKQDFRNAYGAAYWFNYVATASALDKYRLTGVCPLACAILAGRLDALAGDIGNGPDAKVSNAITSATCFAVYNLFRAAWELSQAAEQVKRERPGQAPRAVVPLPETMMDIRLMELLDDLKMPTRLTASRIVLRLVAPR